MGMSYIDIAGNVQDSPEDVIQRYGPLAPGYGPAAEDPSAGIGISAAVPAELNPESDFRAGSVLGNAIAPHAAKTPGEMILRILAGMNINAGFEHAARDVGQGNQQGRLSHLSNIIFQSYKTPPGGQPPHFVESPSAQAVLAGHPPYERPWTEVEQEAWDHGQMLRKKAQDAHDVAGSIARWHTAQAELAQKKLQTEGQPKPSDEMAKMKLGAQAVAEVWPSPVLAAIIAKYPDLGPLLGGIQPTGITPAVARESGAITALGGLKLRNKGLGDTEAQRKIDNNVKAIEDQIKKQELLVKPTLKRLDNSETQEGIFKDNPKGQADFLSAMHVYNRLFDMKAAYQKGELTNMPPVHLEGYTGPDVGGRITNEDIAKYGVSGSRPSGNMDVFEQPQAAAPVATPALAPSIPNMSNPNFNYQAPGVLEYLRSLSNPPVEPTPHYAGPGATPYDYPIYQGAPSKTKGKAKRR